jgi:hypothetical protein
LFDVDAANDESRIPVRLYWVQHILNLEGNPWKINLF